MYKHSFGAAEGSKVDCLVADVHLSHLVVSCASKGGVGVALGIYDATVAFVNVHMASKKPALRRQQARARDDRVVVRDTSHVQYMDLVERLGNKLGADSFQLNEQVGLPPVELAHGFVTFGACSSIT